MIYKTINYTEDGRVRLVAYIPDVCTDHDPLRPAMIACPGGAWMKLVPNEGEPVALTFVKEGFCGFVLYYSIGDYSEFPSPLEEISWAIKTVRDNAEEWHIDPNMIAISGYSAGASVCSMSATQWNTEGLAEKFGVEAHYIRPDAAVLAYGMNDLSTIFDNQKEDLTVPEPGRITAQRTPQLNVINYVDDETSPIFFYHCRYDKYVPVRNTWLLADKLVEHDIPFEMHVFQSGRHGMSVNNRLTIGKTPVIDPSVSEWVQLCIKWLDLVFKKKESGLK